MASSSAHGGLRGLFSRRRRRRARRASHGALPGAGDARWAEQQAREARRELVDSLATQELFALRELVHLAIHKAPVVALTPSEVSALSNADPVRLGASSASSTPPSSTTTSTSTSPPSSTSVGSPQRRQQRQDRVDGALTRSKRFYFPRSADERLRLRSRSHFVRLFPLLSRASRTAQRALFRAFDRDNSGKVEFDELCEALARCRLAQQADTLEPQAALVFAWFQARPRDDALSSSAVRLLATTARELGGKEQRESESNDGYSLVAALDELLLQGQHQVAKRDFIRRMDCDLGAHVLRVLLAPFDVVRTLLDEDSILQEARATQWKAGDTAYVVSGAWWTRWLKYVTPHSSTTVIRVSSIVHHRQHDATEAQDALDAPDSRQNGGQDDQRAARRATVTATARPGPIGNDAICEDEHVATLRPGLVQGHDYVLVAAPVWRRLLQVYGGGPELPRQITALLPVEAQIDEEDADSEETKPEATLVHREALGCQQQRVEVELYPVSLQIRLARHDSRHVYLVFARRFLLAPNASLKEIVHRLGVFPGLNAREVTLWVRRQRLKSWTRLDCSLDGPRATLDGLQITSTQELLVDFRALDIDDDPRSVAQQRRRSSLAACLPKAPFAVDLLQPAGNDFVRCPSRKLSQFAKTGNWKVLGESSVVAEDRGVSVSQYAHHLASAGGSGGVLTGLAKHLDIATRDSGNSRRLVSSVGLRATGLVNMGNTCFMNSALQCFSHSPLLREYFLALRFERAVNKKNRLGSRGAVASAYAQLEAALWRERDQSYLLPGRFRDEFTHVRRHFQETRQHDSHEFMVALLDCLHEDLNQGGKQLSSRSNDAQDRGSKCLGYLDFGGKGACGHDAAEEPSVASLSDELQGEAAWRAHTSMNSSVVVDLFHGQMRSETVCNTCGERKCAFDPNLFFSLPIPEAKFLRVEVSIVLQARALPGEDEEGDTATRTVRRGFWLQRGSNVGSLCDRIASTQGRAGGNRFLFVEVRRSRIKRVIEGDEVVDRLATAGTNALYAYERAWTLSEIPAVSPSLLQLCDSGGKQGRRSSGKIDANAATHDKINSFADLRVGSRVDARDNHNDWHTGTVIEVSGDDESSQQQQPSGQSSLSGSGKKRTPRVCVHFDAFSGRWNKWFTARDWLAQRLLPLHSRTSNTTEVFEVQVVHRFATRASSSAPPPTESTTHGLLSEGKPLLGRRTSANARERVALDIFGTPLFVTVASDKTARDMHQSVLLQAARFWKGFDAFKSQQTDEEAQMDTSSAAGAADTHGSAVGSGHARRSSADRKDDESGSTGLPYSVRVVNLEDLGSSRGEALPFDSSALLQHFSTRSVLVLDWRDYHEYVGDETRLDDDVPDDVVKAAESDSVLRDDLDAAAELVRKQHASEDEDSPSSSAEAPPMHAVPLAKCMDALLRDEAISLEDHWVCERCGVAREGTRRSAIWRLPDLVMVQLKRFQYLENQHKQKVRALVDFPLKGLDFSRWMGHHDASGSDDTSVYDLYAVANHVGGLTRGHYTAYCRYDADFPESAALFSSAAGRTAEGYSDAQCSELWFRFDDEKVSEIAAGDVVTDAAYVLFYKRRTLSPHNVLRYVL